MELRPILSAMLRNRTGAVLVGLQIAITLAVVANAFFIIGQRLEKMHTATGIDSDNLFFVQSYGYAKDYQHEATVRADLQLLRNLPGVVSAATVAQVPLSGGGSASVYQTKPDPKATQHAGNYFEGDERLPDTLGLRIVEGRKFRPEEIVVQQSNLPAPPKQVIMSRALATKMFGEGPVVGKLVYDPNGTSAEIVGVYELMMGSWVNAREPKPTETLLVPVVQAGPLARYAVRTQPGELDRVMAEAEKRLGASGHGRVITWVRPHSWNVERAYRPDRRMVTFLGTIVALMAGVTALGIVGLATFHVNARRKQIGTRRAVGARRIDIVRYFLVENGLLAVAGVIAGSALAYGFSWWLSSQFQLPPLPPLYLALTAFAIVAVGQLAVLWPARRAAAIPPAIATRTV